MLSDFRNDKSKFGISIGYGNTESGDSTYDGYSLNLKVKPYRWLQFTASLPYSSVDGKEDIQDLYDIDFDGNLDVRTRQLKYDNDGIGDLVVMGWVNTLHHLFNDEEEPEELTSEEQYAKLSEIGDPALFFGLGAKLDTGSHDEYSQAKYKIDRESSDAAIFSESDGIMPTRFQMGTGTTDPMLGLVYQQSFGRFQPMVGLSYQMSGGENSVGYERADRAGLNAALKYTAYSSSDCSRQLYITGGVSVVTSLDDDYDHSIDPKISKNGEPNPTFAKDKGDVDGTKGTYSFYSFGVGYDFSTTFAANAVITLPLSGADEGSTYSFDRAIGISFSARF